jgi:hypothetical protein
MIGSNGRIIFNLDLTRSVFLELGDKSPEALCAEVSACPTFPGGQVTFDQNSLRFELTHSGGYVGQGIWEHFRSENPDDTRLRFKTDPDDLYFAIGRCSSF